MFFYPSNECSVGLTIIHKIVITTTDFLNNYISLFRGQLVFGFGELLGKGTSKFDKPSVFLLTLY